MFGTVDIGIISPAFRKLKSFFKNIFIGLKHLELRKRKIVDVIPRTGYYEFKKDSDANNMTVQQYYHETYNINIKWPDIIPASTPSCIKCVWYCGHRGQLADEDSVLMQDTPL